jgi:TPR repeat protein
MARTLRNSLLLTFMMGVTSAAAAPPPSGRPAMRKACDAGDAGACLNLAHALAEGDRGPADPKQALRLYEEALCAKLAPAPAPGEAPAQATPPAIAPVAPSPADLARAAGCHHAARLYHDGESVAAPDLPRASALYAKGCDSGHLEACTWLARLLSGRDGLPADLPRVRAVHGGACDRGLATSCHDLARMLEAGDGGASDATAARDRSSRACDLGEARGCLMAADMAREGRGGPADAPRHAALKARACEVGGPRFCDAPKVAPPPE